MAGCADSPGTVDSSWADSLPGISVPAEHVVFIGLDGWGGAYAEKADMPAVKQMIAGGASSLDMRNILPSVSWPNWSTMFTGTPPEQRSGYDANSPVFDFPSIFTLVNENGGASVFFHEVESFGKICPDGIAEKIQINSDTGSALKIAAYIREKKPAFTAVVFDEPDHAGHSKRWGSKTYYNRLAELDSFISVISQAVKDAGISERTVFVLSADHGGIFWGHDVNLKKCRQIPIVMYGRGIKSGYTIPSPLSITDIAPTMAAILGLETPPEWVGRALKEVFE